MIYLDNAATTLIKPRAVAREMLRAMDSAASPGRGSHLPAQKAAETVYKCREEAAAFFNVPSPEHVVFTMNATHALNIAINSLVKKGTKVLVSSYEHNSVIRPLVARGAEIITAQCPLFDTEAALCAFRDKINEAELVICTHVSNVFGFILPVYEIGRLCREGNIPYIVDASQSAGVLDVDFDRLGADFAAMPGHKALFGPQGTGILLCRDKAEPLMSGGSGSDSIDSLMPAYLPERLEAGTHNVCGIAGLNAGMSFVRECGPDNIREHEQMLLEKTIKALGEIEHLELFYGKPGTQSGVLSMRSGLIGCEQLGALLAEKGICTRSGLHCAPFAHRAAGTLESGTLRISFSPFVSLENALDFCRLLQNLFTAFA